MSTTTVPSAQTTPPAARRLNSFEFWGRVLVVPYLLVFVVFVPDGGDPQYRFVSGGVRHIYGLAPEDVMRDLAMMKIRLAGLEPEAALKLPAELSGGMRKRAGIARALALDPPLLFLDEPTAGLDPIGAAAFDQLILTLRDALGLSVFLVTHDLDTLYTICDRVAVLAEKRVLVADRLDVVAATDNPWIHDYFHGPRGRAAAQAATRVPGSV